eukprot:Pgem_evm1s266
MKVQCVSTAQINIQHPCVPIVKPTLKSMVCSKKNCVLSLNLISGKKLFLSFVNCDPLDFVWYFEIIFYVKNIFHSKLLKLCPFPINLE